MTYGKHSTKWWLRRPSPDEMRLRIRRVQHILLNRALYEVASSVTERQAEMLRSSLSESALKTFEILAERVAAQISDKRDN